MKKFFLIVLGLFALALLIVVVLFVSSLGKAGEDEVAKEPETGFRKGVSYSPKSLTNTADALDFWKKAGQMGTVVRSGGDWMGFNEGGKISEVVVEFSEEYGLFPVIEVNFFNQDTGKLLRPFSEVNQKAYIEAAVDFVSRYKPPYLGIGVEIDTFYRAVPEQFEAFAALFSEVYDAIKEAFPSTLVFTTFQYERFIGLRGGIFGGTNDTSKNNWNLLDKFPKADFIAFSTYPGLIYKDPSNIPSDYYLRIKGHTSKTVAFTEIGWQSNKAIKGWESSEKEQSRFIERFFDLTSDLDMRLAIWVHMYSQIKSEPFTSMALRNADGLAKLAWDAWIKSR